jgi:hypothetical protein
MDYGMAGKRARKAEVRHGESVLWRIRDYTEPRADAETVPARAELGSKLPGLNETGEVGQ